MAVGSENPFLIQPVNAFEALKAFDTSLDASRKREREEVVRLGREAAAIRIQRGDDPMAAIGDLIKIGDTDGARTLATVMHNRATESLGNRQLAQQGSQFTATHGLAQQKFGEEQRQFDLGYNKPPAGYERTTGGMQPIRGGPQDPLAPQMPQAGFQATGSGGVQPVPGG